MFGDNISNKLEKNKGTFKTCVYNITERCNNKKV